MSSPPRPAEAQAGPAVSGVTRVRGSGGPSPRWAAGAGPAGRGRLSPAQTARVPLSELRLNRGARVCVFLSGSVGTSGRASPEAGGCYGGRADFIIIFREIVVVVVSHCSSAGGGKKRSKRGSF